MIDQSVADGFLTLCELVVATDQASPAITAFTAFTRMELAWAHILRTGAHQPVPRPVVMAAMAAAWDIAKANPLPTSYAPHLPGTSALTEWLQDDLGGAVELACRWALDYHADRRVGAAVLLVGNLALAAAARASGYSTTAHAALEALTAGASVVVPVVAMLRTLVPATELATLAVAPHPYGGTVERGDVVHLGLPHTGGVEMLPVQVRQVDPGGQAIGVVAADPISPATCGYRVGLVVPFHLDHVFELVESGSGGLN